MCFCVSRVCGVLCRSRSLHCLSLSPLGVEQPGGVGEERSSQSVREEIDNGLSLKQLLSWRWRCAVDGLHCLWWTGAGSASVTLPQMSGRPVLGLPSSPVHPGVLRPFSWGCGSASVYQELYAAEQSTARRVDDEQTGCNSPKHEPKNMQVIQASGLQAGQEQAGSITGRQAGKQRSKVSHNTEHNLALNQDPEFICRCRLANDLQVWLIREGGVGGWWGVEKHRELTGS